MPRIAATTLWRATALAKVTRQACAVGSYWHAAMRCLQTGGASVYN